MKKILYSSVSLILIIGCMFLFVSCAKDIYTPGPPPTFVDNVEHASAIFGKEYLYPENDGNIKYVFVFSEKPQDEYRYKYYKKVTRVHIYFENENNMSTALNMYKSTDSSTGYYQYCKREYEVFPATIKAVKTIK